ncbi:MAG: hypothetical protein LBR94_07325 [Desulfovibrio sp.]|nr:hypothetical protein [Desulfovibrio sp.]
MARLNGEAGDLFHNDCACAPGANGEAGDTRAPAPEDGGAPGLASAAGRWLAGEAAGVAPGKEDPVFGRAGDTAADASPYVFGVGCAPTAEGETPEEACPSFFKRGGPG